MAKFKVGDKVKLLYPIIAERSGISVPTVEKAEAKNEMTVAEVRDHSNGKTYYRTHEVDVLYGWPEDSLELVSEIKEEEEKYTIREIAEAIGIITGMGKDAVVESQIEQVKKFFAKKAKFQELKEEFLRQQAIYDPQ